MEVEHRLETTDKTSQEGLAANEANRTQKGFFLHLHSWMRLGKT